LARTTRTCKVPPPEKRVCIRHNKPICPSRWRNGFRNSGCSVCTTLEMATPKRKEKRKKRWDSTFIFCIYHPDRRCNRSQYIRDGHRYCASCRDRLEDNSYRPQVRKKWAKKELRRIMERRKQGSQFHHSALRGFELFSRIVGVVPGFNS
jgi:hypothetical protein